MSIPTFEECLYPFLDFLGDKEEHHMREIKKHVSNKFELSEEEKTRMIPSGQFTVIDSRIGWARTYLSKAELIESVARGIYKITDSGLTELQFLKSDPKKMNQKYLRKFPEFLKWIELSNYKEKNIKTEESKIEPDNLSNSPYEMIESGYQRIFSSLQQDLLINIKKCDSSFFEKLVVDLVLAMGYGGSREEISGEVVGKSGDGGIDGIIKEDRLGLDLIYIQAKRWKDAVGSPAIRNFIGALDAKKANKGILVTTSTFTKDALESVKFFTKKVVLIDGNTLSGLMIENNVGISKVMSYDIKKIDSDYFEFE